MDAVRDPFRELTEREKECLRPVLEGLPAKVIAARLGVEPDTVYKHQKKAMRKLGVNTSARAAMLLHEHETGVGHSQDWESQPPDLPQPVQRPLPLSVTGWLPRLARRKTGGGNDLTTQQRLLEIVNTAILVLFAIGAAASSIFGMGWIITAFINRH
jgi:DNA-binding CsgD family transcriptional regulator